MKPYAIANFLTLSRIIAIPVVIFLLFRSQQIQEYQIVVLIVLICMQASDILDGYFARLDKKKVKFENIFGQLMDPVADKLYINSTYITLSMTHNFPLWLTVAVVSRDIFLIIGWKIKALITKDKSIVPNFWGKACDSLQAIYIFVFLFNCQEAILYYGAILTFSLTIVSWLGYFWREFETFILPKILKKK